MEWKAKTENCEAQLHIPSSVLHDRLFEVKKDGKTYLIKYHQKLDTLFIRKPGEKVFRNIKLKRMNVSKSEDSPEFSVDFEILSAGASGSSDCKGETWIYTPASEQRRKAQAAKGATLRSPMTGKILKIAVENGKLVKKGDTVMVIEAMKMENKIAAPADGVVEGLKAEVGANINAGETIIQIKAKASTEK